MKREVKPEWLDEMPADDPEAVRSRRDLRLINGLMGNFRWMRKALGRFEGARVVEIGAGDGGFLQSLGGERAGIDLAPRPEGLVVGVEWVRGDVFEVLEGVLGGAGGKEICGGTPQGRPAARRRSHDVSARSGNHVVVANLFLHHFEDEQLRELGVLLRKAEALCFSEPLRSRLAVAEGYVLWPVVNRVTRHDMMVSIRAGFRRGELPRLLGLDAGEWEIREECTLLGACRVLACRR